MSTITITINAVIGMTAVLITVFVLAMKVAHWFGGLSADRRNFNTFMAEIRGEIGTLKDNVAKILGKLSAPSVADPGSPLKLTDYGQKLSHSLEAKNWAKRVADSLESEVQGKEAYEIHEFCYAFVQDKFRPDAEQEAQIRKAEYEHGASRVHIDEVLALELRDEMLKRAGLVHEAA